jgi:hypothetical protein
MTYLSSTPPNNLFNSAILDSGATGNFLTFDAPCIHKEKALHPLSVTLPDGTIIESTHTAILALPDLPPSANKAQLFPSHFKHSLISVGHLCDHGCEVSFSAPIVTVRKGGTPLFVGWRDYSTGLWKIDLSVKPIFTVSRHNSANNVYEQHSISDTIAYLHAACFSPVKDTWINAIEAGNFTGWPALSPDRVRKYLHKANATLKGHMNQQRQHTRSTQKGAPSDAPTLAPEDTGKTDFVYATIVDSGKIHSDLTGRFPTASAKGNKYGLVLYDYDTNNVLTEPMKSRGDQEMVRAYNNLIQELVGHGFKPRLQRLDNECSNALRSLLNQHYIQFQLSYRHMHRRNAAERAIQTFKNNFIAGLCSVDPNFPLRLWDRLLSQATITLNIMRQYRLNPKVSVYAQLYGHYGFNQAPMAPPGTRVIAHEKPKQRASWDPHAVDGWYLGPATDHYR